MRNQYGRRLRQLVTRHFSMDLALVMHDVDAFHDQVSAYPAITVISKEPQGAAVAADTTSEFDESHAASFLTWYRGGSETSSTRGFQATRLPHWFPGEDS